MTLRLSVFAAALLIAAVAVADVVFLKSGGRIEGRVKRVGDQVHVEALAGSTRVPASSVDRIDELHEDPIEVYDEKLATLKAKPSLEGHLEMAAWLFANRGKRLLDPHVEAITLGVSDMTDVAALHALGKRHASALGDTLRPVWERVLSLEPDDETARRALGYRRLGDGWATEEEWHAAQGEVYFERKWIPREMRDMILEERSAKLKRRIRELEQRERKVDRREDAVALEKRKNDRREEKLRKQATEQARRERDLDERERDVDRRERILDGLHFCRTCRAYYLRGHLCSHTWIFCAKCQGYFRHGHRCRR